MENIGRDPAPGATGTHLQVWRAAFRAGRCLEGGPEFGPHLIVEGRKIGGGGVGVHQSGLFAIDNYMNFHIIVK